MNIKRLVSLILILILLITTMSCKSGSKDVSKESGELTIYLMDYFVNMKNAVDAFNKTSKDVKIKYEAFEVDRTDEMYDRVKSELLAGEGPDMIFGLADEFTDLCKLMDKGAFADIDEYIKKDKSFKLSDYKESVMQYGVYKGKRYAIPLSYYMDAFLTTQSVLDNRNVALKDGMSLDGMLEAANKYIADNEEDKYFFSQFSLPSLLRTSGSSFIDMENNKAQFDSPEFIELINRYRDIQGVAYPEEELSKISSNMQSDLLEDGSAILISAEVSKPERLFSKCLYFKDKQDTVILPVPSIEGDSITARPFEFIAVNSKCKNQNTAYEFIKLLLTEEFQDNEYVLNIPVNTKVYEKQRDKNLGEGKNAIVVSQLDDMIKRVNKCDTLDAGIYSIVNTEMHSAGNKDKSAEELAKAIQEKVESYLGSELSYEEKAKPEAVETTSKLSVCYLDYMEFPKNASNIFKQKYPHVKLEQRPIPISFDENTKIIAEIMAGAGPDVLVYRSILFNSLHKAMNSGAFYDLNELMGKDKEFNISDYNPKMFEYGVYDGRRYFIPLNYEFSMLATTKSILEKYKIEIDESNWTWKEFTRIANKFMENNKGAGIYFAKQMIFTLEMMDSCEISFIDYENRKALFNTKEFIDLLEIYKSMYHSICPNETLKKQNISQDFEVLKNNIAAMNMFEIRISPEALFRENSAYNGYLGENMVIIPLPTYRTTNAVIAKPYDGVSVNAKCIDKTAAFDFIKILLSDEVQRGKNSHNMPNGNYGAPIRISAYEKDIEEYMGSKWANSTIGGITGTYNSVQLPTGLVSKMNSMVKNVEKREIIETAIIMMIEVEVQDFINGKRTAEQTAGIINDKVTLYLEE